MKLRVGLVGLGKAWEVRHRPALRALADRFEVRAVCEQVGVRAEQAAREFGATAVNGYRALAAREDIDAILMLAEQWYGWLPILAACDSGKAIYCAAPLQLGLDEARHIKERVDKAGVAFMAEFARRQNPATLRLKELIATRLGQPRLLFCHRRVAIGERPSKPDTPKDQGFGTSDLVELVDWCRYVVGREPPSVLGMMHNVAPESGDEDYRMMSLDFSAEGQHAGNGVVAQISSGYYMPQGWEEARKGRHAGYHVLNRCELAGHELDFMLVDLRRIFTLSVAMVREVAAARSERIRLLPPYREHLSQAFGRFFMRVGLPVDIAPFK
jgi:predicted dehydrogenase